jgi:hypothetical protein
MKTIIKLEEVAFTAVSIFFLTKYNLGLPVWLWVLLFFSPDISMLGYLVNTKIGAICYNLVHHRAIAIILAAIGFYMHNDVITAIGILLLAHSSFDRMMGYRLKYMDDFKHTHLGWMGKKEKTFVPEN